MFWTFKRKGNFRTEFKAHITFGLDEMDVRLCHSNWSMFDEMDFIITKDVPEIYVVETGEWYWVEPLESLMDIAYIVRKYKAVHGSIEILSWFHYELHMNGLYKHHKTGEITANVVIYEDKY